LKKKKRKKKRSKFAYTTGRLTFHKVLADTRHLLSLPTQPSSSRLFDEDTQELLPTHKLSCHVNSGNNTPLAVYDFLQGIIHIYLQRGVVESD